MHVFIGLVSFHQRQMIHGLGNQSRRILLLVIRQFLGRLDPPATDSEPETTQSQKPSRNNQSQKQRVLQNLPRRLAMWSELVQSVLLFFDCGRLQKKRVDASVVCSS
jgi:hypothetical protein